MGGHGCPQAPMTGFMKGPRQVPWGVPRKVPWDLIMEASRNATVTYVGDNGNFHGVQWENTWDTMGCRITSWYVPWNIMTFHDICQATPRKEVHGISWESPHEIPMETPLELHRTPWHPMASHKCPMEYHGILHGIPWNLPWHSIGRCEASWRQMVLPMVIHGVPLGTMTAFPLDGMATSTVFHGNLHETPYIPGNTAGSFVGHQDVSWHAIWDPTGSSMRYLPKLKFVNMQWQVSWGAVAGSMGYRQKCHNMLSCFHDNDSKSPHRLLLVLAMGGSSEPPPLSHRRYCL